MAISSLEELCKLEVVKHGLDRTDLPAVLAKELEQLEERIVSAFSGTYRNHEAWPWGTFKLAWRQGQWEFILQGLQTLVLVVRAGSPSSTSHATAPCARRWRRIVATWLRSRWGPHLSLES